MYCSKGYIDKIKHAAKIASIVVKETRDFLKPGLKEIDVANFIKRRMLYYGAQGPSFRIIVASGKRTSLIHGYATKKLIGKNDVVMIDCGVKYKGVCSDITRMFFIKDGVISEKPFQQTIKKIYKIVKMAQRQAIKKISSGVLARDIDISVRKIFRKYRLERNFLHSLGHGIGKKVHESPKISYRNDEKLKKGIVITIEPGLYFKNRKQSFGIRLEDMFLVKKNGCKKLTF